MHQMLKALIVVLSVSLVCSFVVTSTAVLLESRQLRNLNLERFRHIVAVAGIGEREKDPIALYRENLDAALIDLRSGAEVDSAPLPGFLHPESFDFIAASRHPDYSEEIDPRLIGLKRRPRYMPVYRLRGGQGYDKVILLIVGKGLWSTLQGYLALEKDLTTIAGIRFFQQGETPGLGGEITNPRWQRSWKGKQALNDRGEVVIELVKGPVDPASPTRVEGISGATLTTRGVNRMVRYWLGRRGYGPYLAKLRKSGG